MRNCFVPSCDHYCKERNIQKRMMFVSPKNKEIFEKWKSRLFNRRPFRATDRICERHFTKDQILTHWDHVIDGKLVHLEREKPRLKENAIPQLNLEMREPSIKRKQVQAPKSQKQKRIKAQMLVKSEACADDEVDASNDDKHENHLENSSSYGEVIDVQIEQLNPSGSELVVAEERTEIDDTAVKRQTFDTIYDDIYEVVLPSTLWGVHRDPDQNFIAFTQFDFAQMNCSKSLNVSNTFDIQATIGGVTVLSEAVKELSIEFLSKALSDLDEQQIVKELPETT